MIKLTLNNFLVYFCLAWGANIALNFLYVLKRYVPGFTAFDRPLDGGLNYRGDRLVGDSATIIGLIMCLALSAVLYLNALNLLWAGIPILVYAGHCAGSFIKRRWHKKDGEFIPLIDHGDYMLLIGIIFVLAGRISLLFAVLALILTYVLHPLACLIAFQLKLRERPY